MGKHSNDPMVRRLLNIIVARSQKQSEYFSSAVAVALREYADAIDKETKGNHTPEVFSASNGCNISIIAGTYYD